jgi:NitT/TauT family transport system permease protein
MAELLATADGVGAALAVTRSQLDTAGDHGLDRRGGGLLLLVEYLVLEPLKREVERWREGRHDERDCCAARAGL